MSTPNRDGRSVPRPENSTDSHWLYSYLDWIGAYSFALALLSALYHRDMTGEGQPLDASQTETGLFLTAVPVLDWWANAREYKRSGNRSPYADAAPHGVYPCQGVDRWLAIACSSEAHWRALCEIAQHPEWLDDRRFATLAERLMHQDALDEAVSSWTRGIDRYDAMFALQARGVPAGVAQTTEDRCDNDPQLRELEWLTEVAGTKIGAWALAEVPLHFSETPTHIGGPTNRGAPCYGEDNYEVYAEFLGLSEREVDKLAAEGVI